ncbi:hypothetical protein HANVADRAFT_53065 [Hanseniaspora valbyensis NRRL Y-1626]|uniref:C2H2-type domain-containing protein n=1 Tax=Hanseniaspora valbyensis NRRL Y-1626 TaxID=766949 RepID=A0A1B7TCQ0_9ASCO|nr:hypothetical protein HANVADRAFT_53065 [Hanseniaspora valbyensis NRRL Y-1626]
MFHCDTCGKQFVRPSSLCIHVLIHSGEKPFQCTFCQKRFNVLSNLRRHEKLHKNKKEKKKKKKDNSSDNNELDHEEKSLNRSFSNNINTSNSISNNAHGLYTVNSDPGNRPHPPLGNNLNPVSHDYIPQSSVVYNNNTNSSSSNNFPQQQIANNNNNNIQNMLLVSQPNYPQFNGNTQQHSYSSIMPLQSNLAFTDNRANMQKNIPLAQHIQPFHYSSFDLPNEIGYNIQPNQIPQTPIIQHNAHYQYLQNKIAYPPPPPPNVSNPVPQPNMPIMLNQPQMQFINPPNQAAQPVTNPHFIHQQNFNNNLTAGTYQNNSNGGLLSLSKRRLQNSEGLHLPSISQNLDKTSTPDINQEETSTREHSNDSCSHSITDPALYKSSSQKY